MTYIFNFGALILLHSIYSAVGMSMQNSNQTMSMSSSSMNMNQILNGMNQNMSQKSMSSSSSGRTKPSGSNTYTNGTSGNNTCVMCTEGQSAECNMNGTSQCSMNGNSQCTMDGCNGTMSNMNGDMMSNDGGMMIMYGIEMMDSEMMDFLQPNTVGRNRSYDDIRTNDGYLCARDCSKYSKPRLCYFQFTLEQYSAMGPACGNCSSGNQTDCMQHQCITADGIERMVLSINRMLPGPCMHVCRGDRVVVDISNMILSGAVAIHWHGILQHGTPWMDGVPLLTQCPIPPMSGLFRYDWYADNPGTHFYHSHEGRQQSDGIHSAVIIRQPNDPNKIYYDYDRFSHTIIVEDWNHFPSDIFYPGYFKNASHVPTQPDGYLINGYGSYSDSRTTTNTPHQQFHVESGRFRYLFRIIAAVTSTCQFKIAFEGHNMTIIAMDGYPCKPKTVNVATLGAGQRIDVVIHAKYRHNTTCSYNILVKGLQQCLNATSVQTAYLVYDNCSAVPTSSPNFVSLYDYNPPHFDDTERGCHNEGIICAYEFETVNPPPMSISSREPDYTFFLRMGFYQYGYDELFNNADMPYQPFHVPVGNIVGASSMFADTINGVLGMMPWFPWLYQDDPIPEEMLCYGECNSYYQSMNMSVCPCINLIKVKLHSTVQLVLIDDMSTDLNINIEHPIHIHGHGWTVVYQGNRSQINSNPDGFYKTNNTAELKKRPTRDTVTIPMGGFATVIFYADNPGMWMFHCHFEDHLIGGMMAIIQVGEREEFPKPPDDFPRCSAYLPHICNLNDYRPYKSSQINSTTCSQCTN